MRMATSILDHYEKHLRAPTDRAVFEGAHASSLQVLRYDGVFRGCTVLATVGLTHFRDRIDGLAEVVLVVDDGVDEAPMILANALFLMVDQKIGIGRGVSIAGIAKLAPSFAKRFDKDALYLTTPHAFPASFAEVACGDDVIDVWGAFFVSAAEHALFVAGGADALEDALEAAGADPFHVSRTSSV
jgi:hypothetical protein